MRFLFRLNLGGELAAGHRGPAEGLGHATRCLALAEALRDRGAEVRFAYRGPKTAEEIFTDEGFAARALIEEEDARLGFRPDATVIDLNTADRALIAYYRRLGPVINLAARGPAKFYADLTFNNTAVECETPPADARPATWHRGPRFAMIPKRIRALRPPPAEIDSSDPASDFSCLVSLGGIDRDNMTGQVLKALGQAQELDFPITVVAGPLNPHIKDLRRLAAKSRNDISFLVDPPDFAQRLAAAALGIFGLGGTTDEALTLGVPSLNLGLTRFHEARGAELEAAGVIDYLGRADRLTGDAILEPLRSLHRNAAGLRAMRRRALALFDGQGSRRVADLILAFLGFAEAPEEDNPDPHSPEAPLEALRRA